MSKFTKKPVTIEAVQFTEDTKNQAFNFITCNHYPHWDEAGRPVIRIETLEGEMTASFGDWIIKGVEGEFYPCKPAIFDKTYLPAIDPVLVEEAWEKLAPWKTEPSDVDGVVLPQLDPSEKNMASAKDWIAILPHDSKSLQIALLSAEESRLEREDQLRVAIAQRDAARKQINPSYQMTDCCMCGIHKHTPVRNDTLGGYVCGGCLEGAYEEIRAALATESARNSKV